MLLGGYNLARYTWSCRDNLITEHSTLTHKSIQEAVEKTIGEFREYSVQ